MTTQYFVRFFFIHLKPRVESFWGVLSCCLTPSIWFNFRYKKTRGSQEPVSFTWLSKKTNWSYVKTMSCSGSHLGITINIKNTKFVKDLPMIDALFRFNQCNSFREDISVFSRYGPVLIL